MTPQPQAFLLFLALSGVLVPHDRPSSAIDTKPTAATLRLVTRVLGLPVNPQIGSFVLLILVGRLKAPFSRSFASRQPSHALLRALLDALFGIQADDRGNLLPTQRLACRSHHFKYLAGGLEAHLGFRETTGQRKLRKGYAGRAAIHRTGRCCVLDLARSLNVGGRRTGFRICVKRKEDLPGVDLHLNRRLALPGSPRFKYSNLLHLNWF
jgi:hypothetical protein